LFGLGYLFRRKRYLRGFYPFNHRKILVFLISVVVLFSLNKVVFLMSSSGFECAFFIFTYCPVLTYQGSVLF
jgi:hypothetical protein